MSKPKPQQDEKGRFVPGNNGGEGRPKGSRAQLGEAFIADLYADWLAHGFATIEKVRAARPADYLKVIASLVPKDVNMKVSAIEGMTDDDSMPRSRNTRSRLAMSKKTRKENGRRRRSIRL